MAATVTDLMAHTDRILGNQQDQQQAAKDTAASIAAARDQQRVSGQLAAQQR